MKNTIFKIIKYIFFITFFCLIINTITNASELISTNEWDYRILDRYASIEGYNGNETELIIPAEIDGIPVKEINNYSLTGHDFTSIDISEGITSIGEGAFSYCVNLESVKIPKSVSSISYKQFFGFSAFYFCCSLTNIEVDPDNAKYSSHDGVLYNKNGSCLYTYPIGKTETSFTIPSGVKYVFNEAFLYCINLTEITFSETVESIDAKKILDCENIIDINVVNENQHFSSEDGILYNKDKTKLILCPPAKNIESYEVPNGVKIIGDNAFYKNKKMRNIVLPDGVEEIEQGAFCFCDSLENINFPNSLTYIGVQAFRNCLNLENVLLSKNLKVIDEEAFLCCQSISEIIIPDTVTKIGREAFGACLKLKTVTFLGAKPAAMYNDILGSSSENAVIRYDLAYEDSWKGYVKDRYKTETFGERVTEVPTTADESTTTELITFRIERAKIKKISTKKKSSNKLRMSLKKIKGVKNYQIAIYKTKKNANKCKSSLVVKSVKKRIVTIKSKKLKNQKTLFVRVRAYVLNGNNEKVYGKWSKIRKVKMKK